jgi:hypothetical protein
MLPNVLRAGDVACVAPAAGYIACTLLCVVVLFNSVLSIDFPLNNL